MATAGSRLLLTGEADELEAVRDELDVVLEMVVAPHAGASTRTVTSPRTARPAGFIGS
jgi:hypothetical protein